MRYRVHEAVSEQPGGAERVPRYIDYGSIIEQVVRDAAAARRRCVAGEPLSEPTALADYIAGVDTLLRLLSPYLPPSLVDRLERELREAQASLAEMHAAVRECEEGPGECRGRAHQAYIHAYTTADRLFTRLLQYARDLGWLPPLRAVHGYRVVVVGGPE